MTNSEFREIFNDESVYLSKEELDSIINEELEKTEEEMDSDLIELCLFELDKLERNELQSKSREKVDNNGLVKKRNVWRYFLAALVAIMLIAGTLTVSAVVFDIDLFDGIIELYNDYVRIRFDKNNEKANGYDFLGSELAQQLAKNGISPVLLPESILTDECQITSIDYEFTDVVTTATIHFNYKGKGNFINISKYVDEKLLPAVDYPTASSEIKELLLNGISVYVFIQSGRGTIAYQDGKIQYVIDLQTDFEGAIDFAKTIK